MSGDFNMTESQNDKAGSLPFEWKNLEKPHWDRFKQHLQLFNPLEATKPDNPNLWHTWCNFQQSTNWIYSRLDRFYANKDFFSFSPNQFGNVVVVLPTTLSDHFPILAIINIRNSITPCHSRNKKFLLNTSLLQDEDVLIVVKLTRLFNLQPHLPQSPLSRWKTNISS